MKKRVAIRYHQSKFESRIQYTLDFIFQHALLHNHIELVEAEPDLVIQYGGSKDSSNVDMTIPAQYVFFEGQNPQNLYCNPYTHKNHIYYSVETKEQQTNQAFSKGKIGFDLLETIFFHISRWEEVHADPESEPSETLWLDEECQLLVRNQLEKIPVVDELISLLAEIIMSNRDQIKTTFSLTHDLDVLYRFKPAIRFLQNVIGGVYHGRGWKYLFKTVQKFWAFVLGMRDPFDTYEFLFQKSTAFKHKILFIMVGGKTKFDNKYSIDDPALKNIVNRAVEFGYNVGLHPSYDSALHAKVHFTELNIINKFLLRECHFNRQHWLRWDWKKTPYQIEKLGFELDSSLGYNHRIGFRCGTGFPYRLYDFRNERSFDFIELPLIYMESALIKERNRTHHSKLEISNNFILNNRFNTHITFNFHNSNFDDSIEGQEGMADLYQALINSIN